jgi:hypothetical protein
MKHNPHRQIKKNLINKNAIKAEIGDPLAIFPESLVPSGKNMSYPFPWISKYCV